jgi:hypothetical protein
MLVTCDEMSTWGRGMFWAGEDPSTALRAGCRCSIEGKSDGAVYFR